MEKYWEKTEHEGVTVFMSKVQVLHSKEDVHEAFEQMASGLPVERHCQIVISLKDVKVISNAVLSNLILLQRQVDRMQGQMRLCDLSDVVQSVFRTSTLDHLFQIDKNLFLSLSAFQR